MILCPISASGHEPSAVELAAEIRNPFISGHQAEAGFEPAWAAIARSQTAKADRYLLVTQPDHARLAGELAAQFRAPFLPQVGSSLGREIGAHDEGWLQFPAERDPGAPPAVLADGRPCSFIDAPVHAAIQTWRGSIAAAARISPLGEYMVSGHFLRVARGRLHANTGSQETRTELQTFVGAEEKRQTELDRQLHHGHAGPVQPPDCIDLLQLCDMLSLYLCCGSTRAVEFPQQFGGQKLHARLRDGAYVTEPSLFLSPVRFRVAARHFPSHEVTEVQIRIS